MAQVSGTTDTYDAIGIREDLEDVIWDLFPEDTWALSNLDKVKASATFHEWQGDSLSAAAANLNIEGDDASFSTAAQPARYGNYTQISKKTFLISGTLEAVTKAGRRSEVSRQAMKQMRELKRDIEYALTTNQAGTAGGGATARSSAGMESYIGATAASSSAAVAVVLSTSTAAATTAPLTSGAPAAPTDGATTGALTEAALKLALESAWSQGGETDVILTSATQKKVIDGFTGIATRFVDVAKGAQASIVGSANVYVSDFGTHKVMLHRYMRTSVVLCLDSSMWATAFLRRPYTEQLAKTGDGTKHQMLAEFCLVARNWKANAKVVACT